MVRNYLVSDWDSVDKLQCVPLEFIIWIDWVSIVDLSRYIAAGCSTLLS